MTSTEPHSSELLSSLQRRIVLIGMMSSMSLAAVDQMILSTAVASISGELGELTQAPWLFTANLLTSSASMPIWGRLGDLYGRRRIFQLAIVIFVVASLLASRSESMIELVAYRALQGLGGGGLLTLPWAIIGDIVSPRARPAYLAFVSAVWAGAGFIGLPLGGFLVDGPGWRWMFYLEIRSGLACSTADPDGFDDHIDLPQRPSRKELRETSRRRDQDDREHRDTSTSRRSGQHAGRLDRWQRREERTRR